MATAYVRAELFYAWNGSSLLIVSSRGSMGADDPGLEGFYWREARFLRVFALTINDARPWLCEAAQVEPTRLAFAYVHPELDEFGGGGTGQSGEDDSTDKDGLPHRSIAVSMTYEVTRSGLLATVLFTNYSRHAVAFTTAIGCDTDFVDIQDAFPPAVPRPRAPIGVQSEGDCLTLTHQHDRLPYASKLRVLEGGGWSWREKHLAAHLALAAGETSILRLALEPVAPEGAGDASAKDACLQHWRDQFTRVAIPRNLVAEEIVRRNIRDFASFPLMEGPRDEWLTLQAGMPLYPALFGRDTLTAGWQAAFVDRGESLDASLTALGRRQSDRVDDWRDEEPGRIPYQVRRGPQAILNLNPYAAYYADFASPLMFVISLAHLYSWTGEKQSITRHWDTARRILEWARIYGDRDGDGYLEYQTRSSKGTKNQGWKDSGDAVVYDDGTAVPSPIATCELQGYWFAAQQLMSVLCAAMGAVAEARAYWRAAQELKERFNRDWWSDKEQCIALALDPDKTRVAAVTSNVGHCLAAGIISDERLPAVVGRLFAPDMFSGWGVRTLSASHRAYNPLSYHRGSVWAVEQSTIALGLRRFGFDARVLDLARAMFDLAALYPEYRIPECIGGWSRGDRPTPAAYPRANTPQLWNATSFALLLHTLLGLQPVAPLNLLVVDPRLPDWMPEVVLEGLRLGNTVATVRFWRDREGHSHAEVVRRKGLLTLLRQPPLDSLTAGVRDRMSALIDGIVHS